MKHPLLLALGSNLEQRQQNLEQALAQLSQVVQITAVSPLYETEPWGFSHQPAFLNACLAGTTQLSPTDLLAFVKNVESQIGRLPGLKWGPRLIDIDILAMGSLVWQSDELTIPHPLMAERAFVLAPLADIAADFVHPVLGQRIADLLTAVDLFPVRRWPQPLSWSREKQL